jgi:hypothetical protein
MASRKLNFICICISALPLIVLWLFYNRIGNFDSTHILQNPNHGLEDKKTFAAYLTGGAVLVYFAVIPLTSFIFRFLFMVSYEKLRITINVFFSLLFILLIVLNLTS